MKHFAFAAAAAAVATATSSVALSATSDSDKGLAMVGSGPRRGEKKNDSFIPKFDGLRFIETLVTAHR